MKFVKISSIILVLSIPSPSNSEDNIKQWSEKSCAEVYNVIALFSALANKEWKLNEEKAARYASAAADYATIYNTVCREL